MCTIMEIASCLHLSNAFSWEEPVITYNFVPLIIGFKPNFVVVPHLCGYWLDSVDIRGDSHHLLKIWIAFGITTLVQKLFHFLTCKMFVIIVRIIVAFLDSLFLMLRYIRLVF